jgi:hypothetical protein
MMALLWVWAAHARSKSVHVAELRGRFDGDRYTVTCRINNPTGGDVELIAAVSVLETSDGDDGTRITTLAGAERKLVVPATSGRDLEVHLQPKWRSWSAVRPQVLLRYSTEHP